MMTDAGKLILRPKLHYCLIDGAYIFLDLETERYFLLSSKGAEHFQRFLAGAMSDADQAWLIERRFVQFGAQSLPDLQSESRVPDVRRAIDQPLPRANFKATLHVILAQLLAKRRLRREPLIAIFNALREQAPPIVRSSRDRQDGRGTCALLGAVAAFRASERIWNSIDQCLPRGMALFTQLRRLGLAPNMVIGVSLPFTAHCWVQIDDCVVSDDLDRVRSFTPIFAL